MLSRARLERKYEWVSGEMRETEDEFVQRFMAAVSGKSIISVQEERSGGGYLMSLTAWVNEP